MLQNAKVILSGELGGISISGGSYNGYSIKAEEERLFGEAEKLTLRIITSPINSK